MVELSKDFPRPVLAVDAALHIAAFSRRALAVFGVRLRDDWDEAGRRLQQAVEADAELDSRLALATAQLVKPGDEEHFEWEHRERRYDISVCADDGGGLFWVFFNDATQRVFSEEILVDARHYLEHILNNIPLGVVVLDGDLKITAVNRPQLGFFDRLQFGLGLVDCIGGALDGILPEDPGKAWQAMCQEVVESGRHRDPVRRGFVAGDQTLVLATEATPLRDHAGRISGVILVCDDVTEETRLEKELVRVEKLATIGQMVITVNHEINNPLSIISNNAQALRLLNPDFDEKTVKKLLRIEEQVKRIAEVTERLRSMEEISTGEYIADGPEMIDVWRGERPDGQRGERPDGQRGDGQRGDGQRGERPDGQRGERPDG